MIRLHLIRWFVVALLISKANLFSQQVLEQSDDYSWVRRIPGFDDTSWFPLHRVSDKSRYTDRVVLIVYDQITHKITYAIGTNAGPGGPRKIDITITPPPPAQAGLLDVNAPPGKDSSNLQITTFAPLKRLRYGHPNVEFLELIRTMASLGDVSSMEAALIFKGPSSGLYESVALSRSSDYPGLKSAVYARLGGLETDVPFKDPIWVHSNILKRRAVEASIVIRATSIANGMVLCKHVAELSTQMGVANLKDIYSLGESGSVVQPSASSASTAKWLFVPNPSASPIPVRSSVEFAEAVKKLKDGGELHPDDALFSAQVDAKREEVYHAMLAILGSSFGQVPDFAQKWHLTQHPKFLLFSNP